MRERTVMQREEIYQKVVQILSETFDLRPEQITHGSHLVQDLDLDSIDAVDLVGKLQQYANKKIEPATFRQLQTINDVVDAIFRLMNDGGSQGT